MRNPNSYGSVIKLQGNRRRPWACRKTIGFNDKGHPIYKYLSYHATRREAIAALREYNSDPYNLDQKTFADVYKLWFEHQNYSEKTGNKYENAFKRAESLHKYRMNELTLPVLQGFFDNLKTTAVNVKVLRSLFKQMIDYSVKRGLLPISATGIIGLVESEAREETVSSEKKVFTKEEISALWKNKDEKYAKLTLFYIYTGLRFAELKNVEWHDDYMDLKRAKSKAGIRIIPLSDKAKSLLPLPELPVHKTFYDCVKYRYDHMPHDTRHTFISMMTEAGVDARIIKKIVGHATGDLTENVYTHISLETMLKAVNRI